jgi:MOSC domain-containing protein YiiM
MPNVLHLFRAPKKHVPMEELHEATLLADFGLDGCKHAQPGGNRQVLLVDRETLDAMDLRPGWIKENITTDGLDVNGLRPGQQLRVGAARLEVTAVCTPCNELEKIRRGLRREIWGRRGMLCRVIQGGIIRCGDAIERLPEL